MMMTMMFNLVKLGTADARTKKSMIMKTIKIMTMKTMMITMMFNLVSLGTAEARTKGSRPIKGLLDMER